MQSKGLIPEKWPRIPDKLLLSPDPLILKLVHTVTESAISLSHYKAMKNAILAFFITIMCDEKVYHTLRASMIARKCDEKYHHI